MADYDNEGHIDLLIVSYSNCYLYRNRGDGSFQQVPVGDLQTIGARMTMGAWGDYDNDGFPDPYVVCGDAVESPDYLYRNRTNGNHRIKVNRRGRPRGPDTGDSRLPSCCETLIIPTRRCWIGPEDVVFLEARFFVRPVECGDATLYQVPPPVAAAGASGGQPNFPTHEHHLPATFTPRRPGLCRSSLSTG